METRHLQFQKFDTLLRTRDIFQETEDDDNINIHKINNNLHRLHITGRTP